ncbi:MAG: response regulator [Anaerolineae bacterium]|nr:response regulator [Anaerolineae bacterium]
MVQEKFENKRILVVDDERDSIDIVKIVLSSVGAVVYQAEDGRAALDICLQERPEVVLADISMPVMDGWELLNAIRGADGGEKVTVIALTAHAMSGDKKRIIDAGFDGYMSKPLTMFTFLEDLSQLLPVTGTS